MRSNKTSAVPILNPPDWNPDVVILSHSIQYHIAIVRYYTTYTVLIKSIIITYIIYSNNNNNG
jgi:hypothetical protein